MSIETKIAAEELQCRLVALRGEDGQIERLITVGMEEKDAADLDHHPLGLGLLGVIADADSPIRVDYIQKDSRQSSSLEGQPQTTSLLGVPIYLDKRQLGQIYLTDKHNEARFTDDDERVLETLADYAAVAISNARSYNELRQRDRTLTRRNQDLALLNNLASALASITELDELLQTALTRLINYFSVDMGEIFLTE